MRRATEADEDRRKDLSKHERDENGRHTDAGEEPVAVEWAELIEGTELDRVSPCGNSEAVLLDALALEKLSVCGDELVGSNVLDVDSSGRKLLAHLWECEMSV